jgi:hypothetical protein
MGFFSKKSVETLGCKLARKKGQLAAIQSLTSRATKVPGWMLDDEVKLAGEVAELEFRIERDEACSKET